GDAVFDQERAGAAGRDQCESAPGEVARDFQQARLVGVAYRQEYLAASRRRRDVRGLVAACERLAEALAHAHHLTGRAHLGSEDRIDVLEFQEWEDRFLHRPVMRNALARRTLLGKRLAGHAA